MGVGEKQHHLVVPLSQRKVQLLGKGRKIRVVCGGQNHGDDICLVGFSGENQGITLKCAKTFQNEFINIVKDKYGDMPLRIIGPSQAAVYKISNKYRFKIIIKCRNSKEFRSAINQVLMDFSKKKDFNGIQITVDMNPQSFN